MSEKASQWFCVVRKRLLQKSRVGTRGAGKDGWGNMGYREIVGAGVQEGVWGDKECRKGVGDQGSGRECGIRKIGIEGGGSGGTGRIHLMTGVGEILPCSPVFAEPQDGREHSSYAEEQAWMRSFYNIFLTQNQSPRNRIQDTIKARGLERNWGPWAEDIEGGWPCEVWEGGRCQHSQGSKGGL